MSSVNNDLFNSLSAYLPESPTIRKAALVVCGIAGAIFLGYQAYQYARSSAELKLREKVADYIVIGCTRDSKLSSDELVVKAEAIAVRKRLCSLLSEIADQEISNLAAKKQEDLKKLVTKVNLAFIALDAFGPTDIKEGNLPSWWSPFESTIKAEIKERIAIKYSDDTSPAMQQKKIDQKKNLEKQIDLIYQKAIAKNGGPTLADMTKKVALDVAVTVLKNVL